MMLHISRGIELQSFCIEMYGGIVVFPSVGILNMRSFLLDKCVLSFLPVLPRAGILHWGTSLVLLGNV